MITGGICTLQPGSWALGFDSAGHNENPRTYTVLSVLHDGPSAAVVGGLDDEVLPGACDGETPPETPPETLAGLTMAASAVTRPTTASVAEILRLRAPDRTRRAGLSFISSSQRGAFPGQL
jgi:hypothetical protein